MTIIKNKIDLIEILEYKPINKMITIVFTLLLVLIILIAYIIAFGIILYNAIIDNIKLVYRILANKPYLIYGTTKCIKAVHNYKYNLPADVHIHHKIACTILMTSKSEHKDLLQQNSITENEYADILVYLNNIIKELHIFGY